jgi:hypothetical protein
LGAPTCASAAAGLSESLRPHGRCILLSVGTAEDSISSIRSSGRHAAVPAILNWPCASGAAASPGGLQMTFEVCLEAHSRGSMSTSGDVYDAWYQRVCSRRGIAQVLPRGVPASCLQMVRPGSWSPTGLDASNSVEMRRGLHALSAVSGTSRRRGWLGSLKQVRALRPVCTCSGKRILSMSRPQFRLQVNARARLAKRNLAGPNRMRG